MYNNIIKMSLIVRLTKTPNAAWEKPKSVLDEDTLIAKEVAYEEKIKNVLYVTD